MQLNKKMGMKGMMDYLKKDNKTAGKGKDKNEKPRSAAEIKALAKKVMFWKPKKK